MDIKEILQNAKTIAIVGLSPKEHRDSFRVAKYLQDEGYKVIPIHPRANEILNERVYRSLLDIEEKIDIINIFVNHSLVPNIIEQINKRNRNDEKIIWSQLGIFNDEAYAKLYNKTIILDKCIKIEHNKIFNNINEEPKNSACEVSFSRK